MSKVSTPVGIVAKVLALLKVGDEGKISSFYSKLESDFTREIKAIKHNIAGTKLEYDNYAQTLAEQLEDYTAAVEDAWLNITADQVATNALQESFKSSYLRQIANAEAKVQSIEESIKDAKEEYEATMKDLNDQISKYEARLAKLRA
jgi:archaellum component FlaC